jgi:hypothetical protein
LTEKTNPTVVVRWDPMPDVEGNKKLIEETQQELPQHKSNKDVEGASRMNNNVGFIEDSNIEESETNIDVGVELDVESNSELEEAESSAPEANSNKKQYDK